MSLNRLRAKYQTELNSLCEEETRAIADAQYALPPNHWERRALTEAKLRSVNALICRNRHIYKEEIENG